VGQLSPAALSAAASPAQLAKLAGREGPTTLATSADGCLYAWGSCHKGKLGNLLAKTLVADKDELLPYLVGAGAYEACEGGAAAAAVGGGGAGISKPLSGALSRWRDAASVPAAAVATAREHDTARGAITHVASASIHSGCVAADGRVYTWGCGSDGRMGVRKFLEGLHGQRSRMKCYISQPTHVELDGVATQLCTSRRHMCALVMPRTTDDSW